MLLGKCCAVTLNHISRQNVKVIADLKTISYLPMAHSDLINRMPIIVNGFALTPYSRL